MDETSTGVGRRPRLQWYADTWPRRTRQLLLDAAVATWCLGWTVVGLTVYLLVAALVEPATATSENARDVSARLQDTGDGLAGLPLLGEQAAAPLDAAAGATAQIADATERLATTAGVLAVAFAVIVPLAPVGIALALWLPARLRFARRAGAARQLLLAGGDLRLLALRARASRPLPQLLAISSDPLGAWERSDPTVVATLARLELRATGVAGLEVEGLPPLPR